MKTKILTTLGIVVFALFIVSVTVYAAKDPGTRKKAQPGRFVGYDSSQTPQNLGIYVDSNGGVDTYYNETTSKYLRVDTMDVSENIKFFTYYVSNNCTGDPYLIEANTTVLKGVATALGPEDQGLFKYIDYILNTDDRDGEVYHSADTSKIESHSDKVFKSKLLYDPPFSEFPGGWSCLTDFDVSNMAPYLAIPLVLETQPYSDLIPPINIVYEYY